jgi:hypothetical protein
MEEAMLQWIDRRKTAWRKDFEGFCMWSGDDLPSLESGRESASGRIAELC